MAGLNTGERIMAHAPIRKGDFVTRNGIPATAPEILHFSASILGVAVSDAVPGELVHIVGISTAAYAEHQIRIRQAQLAAQLDVETDDVAFAESVASAFSAPRNSRLDALNAATREFIASSSERMVDAVFTSSPLLGKSPT